jgi:hypothetical protein
VPDWQERAPWPRRARATTAARVAFLESLAWDGARDPRVRDFARACIEAAPGAPVAAALLAGLQRRVRWIVENCDCYQTCGLTLELGAGDCNALAATYVAMNRAAGRIARVEWLPQRDDPLDHVCAAVLERGAWRLCEPGIAGAEVGEHPYDAAARLGVERR